MESITNLPEVTVLVNGRVGIQSSYPTTWYCNDAI